MFVWLPNVRNALELNRYSLHSSCLAKDSEASLVCRRLLRTTETLARATVGSCHRVFIHVYITAELFICQLWASRLPFSAPIACIPESAISSRTVNTVSRVLFYIADASRVSRPDLLAAGWWWTCRSLVALVIVAAGHVTIARVVDSQQTCTASLVWLILHVCTRTFKSRLVHATNRPC